MIHYHGTPCGGRREDVARFLAARHAMVPFGGSEDIRKRVTSHCLRHCFATHMMNNRSPLDLLNA